MSVCHETWLKPEFSSTREPMLPWDELACFCSYVVMFKLRVCLLFHILFRADPCFTHHVSHLFESSSEEVWVLERQELEGSWRGVTGWLATERAVLEAYRVFGGASDRCGLGGFSHHRALGAALDQTLCFSSQFSIPSSTFRCKIT